jgi:hypothetical protein
MIRNIKLYSLDISTKMTIIEILGVMENIKELDVSTLLLEFEEVLIVALGFMFLLIYLFYIKYPVNKNIK